MIKQKNKTFKANKKIKGKKIEKESHVINNAEKKVNQKQTNCEIAISKDKKERKIGLDIIRTIAILCVFTVHSFAYRGVLDAEQLSLKWTIFVMIRFFAMIAVPLFMLLTGYLNNKKDISKKYYKGIIPLIISYVVISILEIIATAISNDTAINWWESIVKIFNFTANSYAWYFEMYIGLFLLIPFLNILYDSLKENKEKIILIGSLVFLTFVPNIFKTFTISDVKLDIIPDYWQIIYPITYFFIGKFIREIQPNFKMIYRVLFFVVALAIPCTFCYIYSTPTQYAWYIFNGFEALTTALVAISVFLLFYDFKYKLPIVRKVITEISICSFEMYLFSSIWDKYIYNNYTYNMFLLIPLVAIASYVSAKVLIVVRDKILELCKIKLK